MRRREFITLVVSTAAVSMLRSPCAHAQDSAMPLVGYLSNATQERNGATLDAVRQGLVEAGYVDGRNLTIEARWGNERNDRLPELADELVRRHVAVIVGGGISATIAAKAATTSIPIVFNVGVDPVERGLVASLNKPGGNLTGIANLNVRLEPKRLELLHEVIPAASDIALLVNPTNPLNASISRDVEAAADTLKVRLHLLNASDGRELDQAFDSIARLKVGGLVIGNDGLFINRREQLGALTLRHAVPAIFEFREFAAAGGLMSYGGSVTEPYRQVALYVARILKGEKPADLPVQQSTKVDFFLNLKTAKALGLTIPLTLLGRADEVIE
jgi:putative tryptophan/tyrosine transport system substrate-binding protein